MQTLTLYYHPLSSYCHKVLIALYEHGIEFEPRIINLGDAEQRAELCAIWPFGKFPVIRDRSRQRDVAEATIAIEYLEHHFAGRPQLIPVNWEAALDVRLWDRICDNYVQGPLQEIVGDHLRGAHGDMAGARATLTTAYAMIDRQVATRTWLAGEEFTLADCAAAPALFYASTLQPFPDNATGLHRYFERLVARPSFRRVIDEARPYFHLYPFADAIPGRFRVAGTVEEIYNYRRASPRLATSGQPTEAQLAAIAAAGFEVVINLALHDDPRYSLADEPGTVRGLGMDYAHIPVKFAQPTQGDFTAFAAAMQQNRHRQVWVHCAANMRVTAFLGLYRVLHENWQEHEAFQLMHQLWQPDGVWSAFIAALLANRGSEAKGGNR
jgi:glutathione S-transferase